MPAQKLCDVAGSACCDAEGATSELRRTRRVERRVWDMISQQCRCSRSHLPAPTVPRHRQKPAWLSIISRSYTHRPHVMSERIECAFDSDCGLVLGWAWSLRLYFGIRYDCDSFDAHVMSSLAIYEPLRTPGEVSFPLSHGRVAASAELASMSACIPPGEDTTSLGKTGEQRIELHLLCTQITTSPASFQAQNALCT